MPPAPFDTWQAYNSLKEAGFTETQAAALVEELRKVQAANMSTAEPFASIVGGAGSSASRSSPVQAKPSLWRRLHPKWTLRLSSAAYGWTLGFAWLRIITHRT